MNQLSVKQQFLFTGQHLSAHVVTQAQASWGKVSMVIGSRDRRCRLAALAAFVGVALVLGGCTAVIDQRSFFPPQVTPPSATLQAPSGYLMTSNLLDLPGIGTVHGVRLDNPASEITVIYSGGNGSFTASATPQVAALASATGADIILYDYPGRGGTTLAPTMDLAIATGPALIDALRRQGWIGRGPLFAYGVSFGGSQAAAMARMGGFSGLMLEGTAADIARVGRNFVPPLARPLVRLRVDPALARFDYLGYAVAARTPLLLISSQADRVVTPANMKDFSAELRARGAEVEWLSVPGPHGLALRQAKTRQAVGSFVARRGTTR